MKSFKLLVRDYTVKFLLLVAKGFAHKPFATNPSKLVDTSPLR